MKFLKVKTKSGREAIVSIAQITAIEESGSTGTLYLNTTNQHLEITNPSTLAELYALLEGEAGISVNGRPS